jgi:hypothetical protein
MINKLENWSHKIGDAQKRWRWVGNLLTIAAFVYIAAIFIFGGLNFSDIYWGDFWKPTLIALLLYLLSLLFQYIVWVRLISFHHKASWIDMAIYSRVLLLRRLPGGIWHWVGRTAMYTGNSLIPGRTTILANFLEWILLLLIAGAILLGGATNLPAWLRIGLSSLLVGIGAVLAFAWQPIHRRVILRALESLLWLILFLLTWLMGGLIVYIYVIAATAGADSGTIDWLYSTWAWALTGGSSLLLVFVPSGLGIREITLTWILGPLIGVSNALVIALLIRITFIVADLLWGSLGLLISRRFIDRTQVDENTTRPPVIEK